MLKNYLEKYKNRVALVNSHDEIKVTYKTLSENINFLDKFIEEKSINLLLVSNNISSIIIYLAFLNSKKKCVTIILDETFNSEYIKNVINNYKPNCIYYPKYSKIFQNFEGKTFFNEYMFYKTNYKNFYFNSINKILLTTSGTTGSSKFVRLSKINLKENAKSIIKSIKIKKDHVAMTMMPMGYSFGLSIINTHLMTGAKIVINKKSILDREFWNYFKKFEVNSLSGVPEFFYYLKKLNLNKFNLNQLVYFSQAGGSLDLNTKNYISNISKKLNIKFYSMYGQTEASPRISCFDVTKFPKKIESAGKPIQGVRVYKLNKEKMGELLVKGKNICLGYSESIKDLKYGDVNKGTIKTGDVGYIDKDRFIYIKGRLKRIVKLFGFRINLDEIETFLKEKKIKSKCLNRDNKLFIKYKGEISTIKIKNLLKLKFQINSNFIDVKKSGKIVKDLNLKMRF